ncbi:hypothetical protein EDB92DRAFT_1813122 [Lactarius akahatsu]|uniref:Uncharacterized protein n=1 Tax=Lactarius akahatsu TaxID=416441 RepID=A0AAD4LPI3_9AGAM|nr:hypothetical protein EDB92DRAFT_1813122 [Lactarius akahatsu]
MSARFVHGLKLRPLTTSTFAPRPQSLPSSSRAVATSLTFDEFTHASTPAPEPSPTELLVAAKTRDLLGSLERGDSNPSRPWGHYVDLLNYMGLEKLPLELHQVVLRKCVPPASVVRAASARENRARFFPHAPHAYENRLQTVMKNIRSAGWHAELDDYHFILEQFAAVGHYVGSRRILQEMAYAGIQPQPKTYSLCLQALAHRLTLSYSKVKYPALIDETTKMARDLIQDMRTRKLPFTSVNVDLAIRVLRETVDEKGFDELIKFSYGIDLAYPDCLPLEVIEQQAAPEDASLEVLRPPIYPLQPLSTPALNMIIDMLGRTGRISKMVQAFEVLSQPIPKSGQSPTSLFDEDEDDTPVNPPSGPDPIHPLPFAPPNTTTFQFLIKHAARKGHAVFARHYLVQAMHLDRETDARLKRDLNMFLSVFGLSNWKKQVELMRWTLRMIRRTLRRKRKDLHWYTYKRLTRYGQGTALGGDVSSGVSESRETSQASQALSLAADVVQETSSANPSSQGNVLRKDSAPAPSTFSPSIAQVDPPAESSNVVRPLTPPTPSSQHSGRTSESSVFDLDIDSDYSHSAAPTPHSHVEVVLGRTVHRIKERLGRRVWSGKNVWLAQEQARVPVNKEFWKEAVNFVVPNATKLRRARDQRQTRPKWS